MHTLTLSCTPQNMEDKHVTRQHETKKSINYSKYINANLTKSSSADDFITHGMWLLTNPAA